MQIVRVYGLPKIHKSFQHLPKSRPIIDTINKPYHNQENFLTSLLNPLARNEYVAKDSFEVAVKVNSMSFDESLFINIQLKKSIDIILNRL